jgi:predicted cobalt transporter CbtA
MSPSFHLAAQFFPLVIAPGIVAFVRRRWPALVTSGAIDGLVVWLAVVLAAVGFSLLIDFAFGATIGIDTYRRGVLLGLTSATAHTLATGKGKAVAPAPSLPDLSVPGVEVDEDRTKVARVTRADLDFGQ